MINKDLIKKDLKSNLTGIYFYLSALILYLTCCVQFFFFERFFVFGLGSSNLNILFLTIPYVCSLIIPVMVMNCSNPECENNFPFNSITIIISKFCTICILIFLMLIPLFAVPVFVSFFGRIDAGQLICGFIGIIFYIFIAVSFCLFLSAAISSKTIFVIVSIIVLLGINSIHRIPLYIQCGQFITKLCNALSFSWHFDSFSKGIIDTRDVFYYLTGAVFFILLSYFYIESEKGRLFFSGKLKIISVLVTLILCFAFIDSYRIYKRFDFTKDRQFSVSDYTKQTLKSAEEPVRITYYRSKELLSLYPEVRDVYDYLKICALENKNIILKTENADKAENQALLKNLDVAPQQIQSVTDNKAEYVNVYSAIVIEYLGKREVLPFVLSTANLQFDLNMRFDSLIKNKKHAAYILCGNEYNSNDYNYLVQLFNASGVNCYPIEKDSLVFIQNQLETEIPLLLFGTNSLEPEQASIVEHFILKGGKAIIATSPYSININGDWGVIKNTGDNFIPVLEKWGVKFEDKLVNDLSNVRISFYSSDKNNGTLNENTSYEYINYPQWIAVLPQKNAANGLTLFWSSPIKGDTLTPYLYSSKMSWTVKEFSQKVQNQTTQYFVTNPFTVQKSPIEDPLFTIEQSVVAALINKPITGIYNFETNENPSVLVISDQYIAMNVLLELASGGISDFRNIDFIMSSLFNLTGQNELASQLNGGTRNTTLYKITEPIAFEKAKAKTVSILFIIIPLVIIILIPVSFVIRKNKINKLCRELKK